jgi:septum formation protein
LTKIFMPDFLYLASQSPRRSQLLEQLGVRHSLAAAQCGGRHPKTPKPSSLLLPGEAPKAYVERVTGLKLDAAVQRRCPPGLPAAPILCSDTTVALGRRIYGKPDDAQDAARMLGELAGHSHRVLTAVALQVGAKRLAALAVSTVQFAALTPEQIAAYVATGEPLGKAGAYAACKGGPARSFLCCAAAIRASWGCLCLKLRNCCALPVLPSEWAPPPCNKTS